MSTACTVLGLALLKVGKEDNKLVGSIAGTPRAPDRCSLAVTGKLRKHELKWLLIFWLFIFLKD